MKLSHRLNRPEYILRPKQLYRRLLLSLQKTANDSKDVLLPWGIKLRVTSNPDDKSAYSIWLQGIYDVSLTEVIWRLLMPGETAIDVGANIGYVTSLMASKVGKKGKVLCFEPNPNLYQDLCKTVNTWHLTQGWTQIEPLQLAVSNQSGDGVLLLTSSDPGEASLASLASIDDIRISNQHHLSQTYTVRQTRLDEAVNTSQIHLLKIDVEGHEFEVLEGAGEWIASKKIRNIVFEEHEQYPSKATQLLESYGYTVFRIQKGFWKPLLVSPVQTWSHPWEPPNYLATVEPKRALQLLSRWGWQSFYAS